MGVSRRAAESRASSTCHKARIQHTELELLGLIRLTIIANSGITAIRTGMGALPLLDHLISPREQRRRHGKAECLGGFDVDDQLDLRRLLNWKVGRFLATQDSRSI